MKLNRNIAVILWVIFGALILIVFLKSREKENYRKENPLYTSGIITGQSSGSKGNNYIDYTYKVDGKVYNGKVAIDFCLEESCYDSCCEIGTTVRVRYASGDPSNSDLVH